jgi:hypothetical protein
MKKTFKTKDEQVFFDKLIIHGLKFIDKHDDRQIEKGKVYLEKYFATEWVEDSLIDQKEELKKDAHNYFEYVGFYNIHYDVALSTTKHFLYWIQTEELNPAKGVSFFDSRIVEEYDNQFSAKHNIVYLQNKIARLDCLSRGIASMLEKKF